MIDGIAVSGIVVSLVCMLAALMIWVPTWPKKPRPTTIVWPLTWAEIKAAQPHPRRRHSLHCTLCGRFSKVVPNLPGIGHCVYHGMNGHIAVTNSRLPLAELSTVRQA